MSPRRSIVTAVLTLTLITTALTSTPAQGQTDDPPEIDHWSGTITYTASQDDTESDEWTSIHSQATVTATYQLSGDLTVDWYATAELAGSASASASTTNTSVSHPSIEGGCTTQSVSELSGQKSETTSVTLGTTNVDTGRGHGDFRYHYAVAVPFISGDTAGTDTTTVLDPGDGSEDCAAPTTDIAYVFSAPDDTLLRGCPDEPVDNRVCVNGDLGSKDTTVSGSKTWTSDLGWTTTVSWQFSVAPGTTCGEVGARHPAAAAPDSCLTITSPAQDSWIAMTDPAFFTPQVDLADTTKRAPKSRSLLVSGTVSCGCPVSVNGHAATVKGTSWSVQLPGVAPGPVTLTASGGSHSTEESVHVVNLHVLTPTENSSNPITATPSPAMPELDATVDIEGMDVTDKNAVTYAWTMDRYSTYRTRASKKTHTGSWKPRTSVAATGTTVGTTQAWRPHDNDIEGGWARIHVTATIPRLVHPQTTSDPRWIDIPGTNPGKAAVVSYLTSTAGTDADVAAHLDCHESQFVQFNPSPDPQTAKRYHPGLAEPKSKAVPSGWDNPAAGRPLFGGPPAGIGIAQLDPAGFPTQQWNWQQNVDGGLAVYRAARKESNGAEARTQKALEKEYQAARKEVDADRSRRHLPPLASGHADVVPPMTTNQHIRDAIRRYNGGREYTFGGHYVADTVHDRIGEAGLFEWLPVLQPAASQDYLTQVRTCPGLPVLELAVQDGSWHHPQKLRPGQFADIEASGFPAAEEVDLVLHSKAKVLRHVRADSTGTISLAVKIPKHTRVGKHHLVVTAGRRGPSVSFPLVIERR